MRQGQQSRRGRNRGRKPQNSISRNYESSGPDVKIRGTAMHIAEKYTSLARDAMASGDSVAAENYLQHAEHYNRIILAAQAQNAGLPGMEQPAGMNGGRFHQGEPFQRDFDGESEDGDGEDFVPQLPQQRGYQERPAYNSNQPQPFIPQNAFPQVQQHLPPASPASNGAAPHTGESFVPADGQGQRRRRRRPMGEHQARGFNNGRHGGQPGPAANGPQPAVNGGAPAGDPAPDEASS
jgi:hypothetical protein